MQAREGEFRVPHQEQSNLDPYSSPQSSEEEVRYPTIGQRKPAAAKVFMLCFLASVRLSQIAVLSLQHDASSLCSCWQHLVQCVQLFFAQCVQLFLGCVCLLQLAVLFLQQDALSPAAERAWSSLPTVCSWQHVHCCKSS